MSERSYQILTSPEIAASDPSVASRLRIRNRIRPLPTEGLTVAGDVITRKGDFQVDFFGFVEAFFGFTARPGRREWLLVAYTSGLTVLAAGLVIGLLRWPQPGVSLAWPVAALALAALVAERQSVRLTPRVEVSVAALPILLTAVIYGPLAAICVSAVSLVPSFEQPYARWLTWTATRSLTSGCAGIVAFAVQGSDTRTFARVVQAVAAATLVEQGGSALLASITASLRGVPAKEIRLAGTIFLAIPLYIPVGGLLVYASHELSPWSVVLFLFPAFVAQKLFLMYREQLAMSQQLAGAIARQERAHLSFASALVATLDARDEYTAGHSGAVAVYARDIARQLGLSKADQRLAHLAGLVHDIGKIGLPPGLLEKPGCLTSAEREIMQQHSVIGERILSRVEDYEAIASVVRHHHEHVDGTGYPDGLRGDAIPILSRIIAVADAYNAMTSDRPYREAMPAHVARLRLGQNVETQFDTSVVAAFEAVLAAQSDGYRAGNRLVIGSSLRDHEKLAAVS